MPLKLIRMNEEAVAKIDAKKELKPNDSSEATMKFYWRECPHLVKTDMESKNGIVMHCAFEDKYSNSEESFDCQVCDKYRTHKGLMEPRWN